MRPHVIVILQEKKGQDFGDAIKIDLVLGILEDISAPCIRSILKHLANFFLSCFSESSLDGHVRIVQVEPEP